jgi:hypothetical protein
MTLAPPAKTSILGGTYAKVGSEASCRLVATPTLEKPLTKRVPTMQSLVRNPNTVTEGTGGGTTRPARTCGALVRHREVS